MDGRKKRLGKYYSRENALLVARSVAETNIPHDTNRDEILRWINYGFDKRESEPEINPFRLIQQQHNEEITKLDEEKRKLQVDIEALTIEEENLNQKIQHFEAHESAFLRILDSGLFTQRQMENLDILEDELDRGM